MNPAGAFVVDPDTQHLYAAYGRGNIPQLERQKLMTGEHKRISYDTDTSKETRTETMGGILMRREPESRNTPQPPKASRKVGRRLFLPRGRARQGESCASFMHMQSKREQ